MDEMLESAKRWAASNFVGDLFEDGDYTAEQREEDKKLAYDVTKVVGEIHVGGLHIIALELDDQVFIVRYDNDKLVASIEWRDQ